MPRSAFELLFRDLAALGFSCALLVRRAGTYKGTWCIPCGFIEYHEEIRTAAAREMTEETGLIVEVGSVFAVHSNFHNPAKQTVGTWFLTRYLGGELRCGDDADRVAFYPLSEPPKRMAFPTDEIVVGSLLQARR